MEELRALAHVRNLRLVIVHFHRERKIQKGNSVKCILLRKVETHAEFRRNEIAQFRSDCATFLFNLQSVTFFESIGRDFFALRTEDRIY